MNGIHGSARSMPLVVTLLMIALMVASLALPGRSAFAENIDDLNVTTEGPTDEEIAELMETVEDDLLNGVSPMARSAAPQVSVQEFSGADRFEVSEKIARAGYPNGVDTVILVGENGWADALCSTGLAGVLDCPVVVIPQSGPKQSTYQLLSELGAKHAIIVGGPNSVSAAAEGRLESCGVTAERIGGADRYEVSTNIYNYAKGKWGSDLVLVASGHVYPDALSVSPVAFAKRAPIFLVDGGSGLHASEKSALEAGAAAGLFQSAVIAGGPNSVPESVVSYMDGICKTSSGSSGNATRVGGADRYQVSAGVASWAVSKGYLTWENAAFASGTTPFDALSGSVLQGKRGSVLLLTNSTSDISVQAFINSGSMSVSFFGGPASLSNSLRSYIKSSMQLVTSYSAGTSLSHFVDLQTRVNPSSRESIQQALDPMNYTFGSSGYYQFADLSRGYSGKVTAEQINAFIQNTCDKYGYSDSLLLNQGEAIIQAAKSTNVNEVYLLAHAILESGWGRSPLAQGRVPGYEGYYNFYGIGAYDLDPNNGGAALAKSQGWNTPAKALQGAAAWISSHYIHSSYGQNTLYKMRWNLVNGAAGHQYATSLTWASSIARLMGQFYGFVGYDATSCGLKYYVPSYQ